MILMIDIYLQVMAGIIKYGALIIAAIFLFRVLLISYHLFRGRWFLFEFGGYIYNAMDGDPKNAREVRRLLTGKNFWATLLDVAFLSWALIVFAMLWPGAVPVLTILAISAIISYPFRKKEAFVRQMKGLRDTSDEVPFFNSVSQSEWESRDKPKWKWEWFK